MIIDEKQYEYILKRFEENKNVVEFKEKTPEGNTIRGLILLNRDYYHGSLLIKSVNGEDTLQFVHGFPKIENYERVITQFDEKMECLEKLDGTCVGLYKLYDSDGSLIEYVPKSRQQAVLDPHFQSLFDECKTDSLTSHINEWDCLFFEMYGQLNPHTIRYDNKVNLRLLGAVNDKNPYKMLFYGELKEVSKRISIEMPSRIATIKNDNSNCKVIFEDNFMDENSIKQFDELDEAVIYIKEVLDNINEESLNEDKKLRYEGIVLQNTKYNSTYDYHYNEYIKCKPETFMNFNKKPELPIAVTEIDKEVKKVVDENYTRYTQEYNEKEVIKEINTALGEEFDEKDIKNKNVQGMIKNKLHTYIDVKSCTNLEEIADSYVERYQYKSKKIGWYMKIFAKENPMLKHHSRNIYNLFKQRLE